MNGGLVGTQLSAGMTNVDAAYAFVQAERAAFQRGLDEIEAKHQPVQQEATNE